MASQEEIPLLPIAGKSLEVDVGGIDPNLTLRVLEPKTFRHLDDILNSCPAVETKRRHFKHTREFADSGGGLVFVEQPDLIQDFDCCFVFPSDLSEESDGMCQTKTKIYSDLEVREKLMRICTARDVNDTNKGRIERSDIASALPFYELHRYVGSRRSSEGLSTQLELRASSEISFSKSSLDAWPTSYSAKCSSSTTAQRKNATLRCG